MTWRMTWNEWLFNEIAKQAAAHLKTLDRSKPTYLSTITPEAKRYRRREDGKIVPVERVK